jgi:hypothetical protein
MVDSISPKGEVDARKSEYGPPRVPSTENSTYCGNQRRLGANATVIQVHNSLKITISFPHMPWTSTHSYRCTRMLMEVAVGPLNMRALTGNMGRWCKQPNLAPSSLPFWRCLADLFWDQSNSAPAGSATDCAQSAAPFSTIRSGFVVSRMTLCMLANPSFTFRVFLDSRLPILREIPSAHYQSTMFTTGLSKSLGLKLSTPDQLHTMSVFPLQKTKPISFLALVGWELGPPFEEIRRHRNVRWIHFCQRLVKGQKKSVLAANGPLSCLARTPAIPVQIRRFPRFLYQIPQHE